MGFFAKYGMIDVELLSKPGVQWDNTEIGSGVMGSISDANAASDY